MTCEQMRSAEALLIKSGVSEESLMEHAGREIAKVVASFFPRPGKVVGFIGTGHNGGDALVALRYLRQWGWKVAVECAGQEKRLKKLSVQMRKMLGGDGVRTLEQLEERASGALPGPLVLLDGLLGVGASGPLRGPLLELSKKMNQLRLTRGAYTVAMDLPSGIDGNTGSVYHGAVIADYTVTVGAAKVGLLQSSACNHVGRIALVELPELDLSGIASPDVCLNSAQSLVPNVLRRDHEYHKGNAGTVSIVAGSRGMLGAAVLAATGALRAGAGIVRLFVSASIYNQIVGMLPAEVMVVPCTSYEEVYPYPTDSYVVGPGIGVGNQSEQGQFCEFLKNLTKPMVLDADALNRIAAAGEQELLTANVVLTPHPGEMKRLLPETTGYTREQIAKLFCALYPSTLLYKGSKTIITRRHFPICVNATGHAGMASGGQGDVLSGVIGACLARGLSQFEAARLGSWACGRAAELAVSIGGCSEESVLATDVLQHLGRAFEDLRTGGA
ncbi:NAD(P)H-hydrate dehydratase [Persicirhabdus sediminis]|uniref:Bifunctional NAD(P)H-hydrate repair enzyme n=1 Tax=Persicirhabdus sediminis TaxID=454144 RepID=A0A8J7MCU3_9BACT|nr:NAD(P)H-hydrate dehydratase [Persicirhabdus sediminis]